MLSVIDPFYFLIALFIGLFITYSMTPMPKVVYKYPTPDSVDDTIYENESNTCYKYEPNEVDCPKNKSLIKDTPIN